MWLIRLKETKINDKQKTGIIITGIIVILLVFLGTIALASWIGYDSSRIKLNALNSITFTECLEITPSAMSDYYVEKQCKREYKKRIEEKELMKQLGELESIPNKQDNIERPSHISINQFLSATEYDSHTLFQFNKTVCYEINSANNGTRFFKCENTRLK